MGGGSSWEKSSSLLACKGYDRASENSQKGSGQKKEAFHGSVHDEYSSLVRDALDSDASWITKAKAEKMLARTPLAVVVRAKKVKTECLKFDSFVNIILAAKPTGDPKPEDIHNAALAIYNGDGTVANMYRYLRGDEAPSKEFPFTTEYDWMKETSAFRLLQQRSCRQNAPGKSLTTEGSAAMGSDSSEDAAASSLPSAPRSSVATAVNQAVGKSGFKRPLGRNKAGSFLEQNKAISKGSDGIASLAEAAHKRAKLSEEALVIEKKKAETESLKATLQLFSIEGCCPVLRAQVVKKLQEKALADIVGSNAPSTAGTEDNPRNESTEKPPSSDDEPEEAALCEEEGCEIDGSDS